MLPAELLWHPIFPSVIRHFDIVYINYRGCRQTGARARPCRSLERYGGREMSIMHIGRCRHPEEMREELIDGS
jgi:hypothetical protein